MPTKTIASVGLALILTVVLSVQAEAGRCDGYHGCRCGVTAASYNGLALNYNGFNLKRAVEYIRAFPRTVFQAGAIGYVRSGGPSGHVFTVVNGTDCTSAMVHDDKGTYRRNVCHAVFVAVRGAENVETVRSKPQHRVVQRRTSRSVQIAVYAAPDRNSFH